MFLLIPDSIVGNKFGDDGLAKLLQGLQHNTTLTNLKSVDYRF
jgi:hypothetical protein